VNRWDVLEDVQEELERATAANGPFNSAHEGYAVILEELDELWEEVRKKSRERDPEKLRKEAIQVAAMGVRFVLDVCGSHPDEPSGA
jgi:hypothetical protein